MAGSFQQNVRKYERRIVERMNFTKGQLYHRYRTDQEKNPSGVKLPVRRTVTGLA